MGALPKSKHDLEVGLPDTSGPLRLTGLEDTIEVIRDDHGIPHIRARSSRDAFFGQGFATAQDRLWHMDYFRRWAYGRWAEFAGKTALAQDRMMRRFQIARTVQEDYRALNSDARAMLDAYAAGVNAFIESADSLPIEYSIVDGSPERWQPWDCLAVYKVRHVFMGKATSKLTRARLLNILGADTLALLRRNIPANEHVIVAPDAGFSGAVLDGLNELIEGAAAVDWMKEEAWAGSNNWVLTGSRTASGRPLLAGDAHRPPSTPNVYYQNHITCPEFDAIGLSFAGYPGFPNFGHNAYVAWSVTNGETDTQDLYVERFRRDDATRYELNREWVSADVRHERIDVRDGKPEEMDVTVTAHGPVIGGDPAKGYGIAFKYPANTVPDVGAECILRMLTAKSTDEIDEAMRQWVDSGNSFLFADVLGNIGFLTRSKVPVRSMANAWLPVPGWTGEHEWQGYIPFDEMPRLRNPEAGYIATANNRVVDDDYPHYISIDYAPEFRVRRVISRLKALSKATVDDMAAMHSEALSIPAQTYTRLLARRRLQDDFSALAQAKLQKWDCVMRRDAAAPLIYSAFRMKLNLTVAGYLLASAADRTASGNGGGSLPSEELLHTVAGLVSSPLITMARTGDTALLPPGTDWDSLLPTVFTEAATYLRERLGDDIDGWRWGTLHYTRSPHTLSSSFPSLAPLLDPPSFSMGGDGETPSSGGFALDDPFVITGMPVCRYVFDLSDWDRCRWIVPLGASGHPGSSHYTDQARKWAEYELIPMLYRWDLIESAAESRQQLSPR